jgi:hypothetical protein
VGWLAPGIRLRASFVTSLLAISIVACGSTHTDRVRADLRFQFTSIAPSGFIDQTLWIENSGPKGVAPTLEFTPVDAAGNPVDGVVVQTAFGSDKGALVVPPGARVLDILRFSGEHRDDVEDVRVRATDTTEVDVSHLDHEISAERVARDGGDAGYGEPFERVVLRNPNPVAVSVRVLLLQFDPPPRGEPQQFVRARHITGLVRLAPRSRRTVELERTAVGSVQAYLTR